jgi:hypothetical protein
VPTVTLSVAVATAAAVVVGEGGAGRGHGRHRGGTATTTAVGIVLAVVHPHVVDPHHGGGTLLLPLGSTIAVAVVGGTHRRVAATATTETGTVVAVTAMAMTLGGRWEEGAMGALVDAVTTVTGTAGAAAAGAAAAAATATAMAAGETVGVVEIVARSRPRRHAQSRPLGVMGHPQLTHRLPTPTAKRRLGAAQWLTATGVMATLTSPIAS